MDKQILTINGGSSSIKFALFSCNGSFLKILEGKIDRIGYSGTFLEYSDNVIEKEVRKLPTSDFSEAIETLNTFLSENIDFSQVTTIGHRVVHGMGRATHEVVTPALIRELKETSIIDPEHLPVEIKIIEMFTELHPNLSQIACFDTVFHHDMPRVAQMLPIPRQYESKGLRRYGFHGLSCASIIEELKKIDESKALGNVIIAHLGNGASVTALKNGKSFDTSMGFTPTGGIPMSSRTGDIDPSILWYLMKNEDLSLDALNLLINHESGLLGISETSGDMHDLLSRESTDERAHEAIDFFCYEVKKQIGAYVAALGGVDTIIFTGGMGDKAVKVRHQICEGLQFLGINLDEKANQESNEIISLENAPVLVRVMRTDEELSIAKTVHEMLHK